MLIAALLLAQAAPAACSATDVALPPTLAGWTTQGTTLEVGKAMLVTPVEPTAAQSGPDAPKRPGGVASVTFTVTKPGTYRIALDQPGWIDVRPAGDGPALESTGHGHGPQCSTIRKLVAFDLKAQSYRLELSGITRPTARVMLVAGE